MLNGVFYFVLNMSLAGAVVIAALLLLRLVRPLPRRLVYPLWALAFVRLAVPFSPPAPWSLFRLAGALVRRLVPLGSIAPEAFPIPPLEQWSTMNFIGAARSYAPVAYRTQALHRVFAVSSAVWAIVALAALLAAAALYALTLAELRKAAPIRGNLYRSDMLLSPVLTGVLRPRIVLPPGLDPDSPQGQMVLAHEDVHRRRLDNLWRALAIGIACIHWFNPLVWVMLRAFFTDMELSCDEAVLRRSGDPRQRKAYAGALLRFAEDRRLLLTSFGRSGVKVRIVHALNYRRMTWVGAIASAAFVLAVALALLTNPLGG